MRVRERLTRTSWHGTEYEEAIDTPALWSQRVFQLIRDNRVTIGVPTVSHETSMAVISSSSIDISSDIRQSPMEVQISCLLPGSHFTHHSPRSLTRRVTTSADAMRFLLSPACLPACRLHIDKSQVMLQGLRHSEGCFARSVLYHNSVYSTYD